MNQYSNKFFDRVEIGAVESARAIVPLLQGWIAPASVIDVGCGRGAWLEVWRDNAVQDVTGVDGAHVDAARLRIREDQFIRADLALGFSVGRRYDVAQCLEVAEHLPKESSKKLVQSIAALADIVMFSAAVPGQGGTGHINERPIEFWRRLFMEQGYAAFDAIRPAVAGLPHVEPWYRYNTILYANERGATRLPEHVTSTRVPSDRRIAEGGSLAWRMRRFVLRCLPRFAVEALARRVGSTPATRHAGM